MGKCKIEARNQLKNKALDIATKGNTPTEIKGDKFYDVIIEYPGMSVKQVAAKVKEINRGMNSMKVGNTASINLGLKSGNIGVNVKLPNEAVALREKELLTFQELEISRKLNENNTPVEDYGTAFNLPEFLQSPLNSSSFNFNMYKDAKESYLTYVNHRVAVLSKMADKSRANKLEIANLKALRTKLRTEISIYNKSVQKLEPFFDSFNKDIETIEKLLQGEPTMEKFAAATVYLDKLHAITNKSNLQTEEEMFDSKGALEGAPAEDKARFKDFVDRINAVKGKKENIANTLATKLFIARGKQGWEQVPVEQKDIARELGEVFKNDLNFFDEALSPLDADQTHVMDKVVRKIHDDAISKKEAVHVQEELAAMKPALMKILKKMKPSKRATVLGKRFSPTNFDIFKTVTKDGNVRLVSRYTEEWEGLRTFFRDNLKEIYNMGIKQVKAEKYGEQQAAINFKRKALFDKVLEGGGQFIDLTRLDEFRSLEVKETLDNIDRMLGLPEGTTFKKNFHTEVKGDYKEMLISEMLNKKSSRPMVEKELKHTIDDQLEKLFEYEAHITMMYRNALEYYKADSFDNLPEASQNKLIQEAATKSPLELNAAINNNNNSIIRYTTNRGTFQSFATLEYSNFVSRSYQNFSKSFDVIENDPTLFKAWQLFKEGYAFINDNRHYQKRESTSDHSDSIPSDLKLFQRHGTGILKFANRISKKSLNYIKDTWNGAWSVSKDNFNAVKNEREGTDTKIKIRGSIKSLDEYVKSRADDMVLTNLSALGFKAKEKTTAEKLDSTVKDILKSLGEPLPVGDFIPFDFVMDVVREKVMDDQNVDMVDSIISQIDSTRAFKAKKEVELQLTFLRNLEIKNSSGESKEAQKNRLKYFIQTHLEGRNDKMVSGKGQVVTYTAKEKKFVKDIQAAIEETEKLLSGDKIANLKIRAKLEKHILALTVRIAETGSVVSTAASLHTLFIKGPIIAGMGFKLGTQAVNKFIGNTSGKMFEGLVYSRGNYSRSVSYLRLWRKGMPEIVGGNSKQNMAITNSLFNTLGIFQNSANEITGMVDQGTLGNFSRKLSDALSPLYLVGETEKMIQKPQVLAAMGDIRITGYDEDGNSFQVPLFDTRNLSNPHPAFEIVDGTFKLKKEFDTPSNRGTWIERTSQEYSDLFGESGKVPKIIATINGDYRGTSTNMLKKSLIGAAFSVFKTWATMYFKVRYGEAGVYTKLNKEGHSGKALGIAMIAAMSTTVILGTPLLWTAIMPAAIFGVKPAYKLIKSIGKDADEISRIGKTIQRTSILKSTGIAAAYAAKSSFDVVRTVGLALPLKAIQTVGQIITPRFDEVIKDKHIDALLGIKSNDEIDFTAPTEETELMNLGKETSYATAARVHFLLSETMGMLKLVAAKAIVVAIYQALDYDDEDYEDFIESPIDRKIMEYPTLSALFLTSNLINSLGQSLALSYDPNSMVNMSSLGVTKNLTDIGVSVIATYETGPEYMSGLNEGKNRVGLSLSKFGVPGGISDYQYTSTGYPIPMLGLSRMLQEDTSTTEMDAFSLSMDTPEEHLKAIRTKMKSEYKLKLINKYVNMEKYEGMDMEEIKKAAEKAAKTEFPAIGKYFDKEGNIKLGRHSYLKKYDKEYVMERKK